MKRIFLSLGLVLMACTKTDLYRLDSVTDASVSQDASGQRILSYKVTLESMFHSPGVLRDPANRLQVVRCKVGATCKIDFASRLEGETYKVLLPPAFEAVTLIGPAGEEKAVR